MVTPGHGPTRLGWVGGGSQLPKAWREGHTLHVSEARVLVTSKVPSKEKLGQLSGALGSKPST